MNNLWDRERESIDRDYEEGLIGSGEAARLLREVDRDEREAMQAEREEAHEQLDRDLGYGR